MKSLFTSLGLTLFCLNFTFAQELRLSTSSDFKYDIEIPSGVVLKSKRFIEVFPSGKRVNPPLISLQPDFNRYTVSTEQAETIEVASGTSISIPANAFLDEYGLPVKGEVKLFYKELNSAQAIMLSGIPMDSKDGQLESAAMFEIRATQNGETVYPNPNAPIEILFPATPIGAGFSYYNYDEEGGEWIDKGTESLLDPPLNFTTLWQSMNSVLPNRGQRIPSPIGLSFDVYRKKHVKFKGRERGLQIRITAEKRFKSPTALSFQELRKFNNINWVYVGDQSRSNLKEVRKRLRSIRSKRYLRYVSNQDSLNNNNVLVDCWLAPNYDEDFFLLHIATLSDTLQLPVVPFTFAGDYQEQKNLSKLFLKYEARWADRKIDWQTKLKRFYEIMESEDAASDLDPIQRMSADLETENLLKKPRQVRVLTFGVCNIDRIIPMMSEEILVECMDEFGEKLKIKSIVVCNERVRTVMDFPDPMIQVPSFSKNSMLVKFDNGKIAIIKDNEFKRGLNKEEGLATYTVKPIVEENLEGSIRNLMASK